VRSIGQGVAKTAAKNNHHLVDTMASLPVVAVNSTLVAAEHRCS
jgi:hypothetical protein